MRYFFEVAYDGSRYAGFQIQKNANTIQAEVEKALQIFFRQQINLTGSSRTDAGVHALQNFFHGDFDKEINADVIYNLNAILPSDIVLKSIMLKPDHAHCRFDATSREYHYHIYTIKDPFMLGRGYYYPYKMDHDQLIHAANYILSEKHFAPFSKINSQAKTDICIIETSKWEFHESSLIYKVKANRFLRGMVRALVATMLKVGTGKSSIQDFQSIFKQDVLSKVDFASPPQGLFLTQVCFPFENSSIN